jgi:hypothetical protein
MTGSLPTVSYYLKEKVLSPSLNYQRSLVSVPGPENRVSYVPELSKPYIFSPSLVLMVVFDDVAAAPACQGWVPQSFFSPPPLWKAGAVPAPVRGG